MSTTFEIINGVNCCLCPECRGDGENMEAHQRPWGYSEVMVECKFCEGIGYFEEDEYLMMKLEGKV
jgi:DnaJ-class molecular chaperone